jgi:hypothetical protein
MTIMTTTTIIIITTFTSPNINNTRILVIWFPVKEIEEAAGCI